MHGRRTAGKGSARDTMVGVRELRPRHVHQRSSWHNGVDSGTALGAAKAFSDGKVDLAVVRGDVGDLSKAQAVVVMSHVVALVIAPPGSTIDSMDKLKGRRVGVLGGDANTKIVDVLSKEYGFDREKVFRDIALPDARRAIQSKEMSALLVVIPMAGKYLSMVRDIFQQVPNAS